MENTVNTEEQMIADFEAALAAGDPLACKIQNQTYGPDEWAQLEKVEQRARR